MTPQDEIETFLLSDAADAGLRLDLALEFSRSMAQELRRVLAQWDAVVDSLEHVKPDDVAALKTRWRRHARQ